MLPRSEIQKILKKLHRHVIVEVGSRKKRPALNSCFKSLFIWWVGNERNGYYRSMICNAISFYMLFEVSFYCKIKSPIHSKQSIYR